MDEAYVGLTGGNRTPTETAAVESRAEQSRAKGAEPGSNSTDHLKLLGLLATEANPITLYHSFSVQTFFQIVCYVCFLNKHN